MNRGLVKILFNYGESYVVEIGVRDELYLEFHKQWSQIKTWWLYGTNSRCLITWDDGSELLLDRDSILNVTMTPRVVLEIV